MNIFIENKYVLSIAYLLVLPYLTNMSLGSKKQGLHRRNVPVPNVCLPVIGSQTLSNQFALPR